MNQKLVNNIKERILFCYNNNSWSEKGNIIEVMRMEDFKIYTYQSCIAVAEIFYENGVTDAFIGLNKEAFDQAYLTASRTIESNTLITINPVKELKLNYKPSWLIDQKIKELGWDVNEGYKNNTYRTRYFEYLQNEKGWKKDVLDEVKDSSLKVIKNIGNPNSGNSFFVRGMVLGSVQSGKTTNFNAVINSAIDIGYQLIIVFCGTIEDLRGQTFQRISTDVIGGWQNDPLIRQRTGRDYKGVSNIYNFGPNEKQVNMITGPDRNGDFNANTAAMRFDPNRYNIAVCKKNVSIIRNLLLWLNQFPQARNLPTLIIDDECDNASLNNNGNNADANPSQINAGIRALLNMFHKKTYLGYTATPFANILQFDGSEAQFNWSTRNGGNFRFDCCTEDLFPEDFIQLLSPPTNYLGIKDFFDTRDPNREKIEGLIETIPSTEITECFPLRVHANKGIISGTDSEEPGTRASKKDDPFPDYLPDSLKDAIKCFILSIALRYSRKKEQENFPLTQKHHSMLIHISRYTQWIDRTKRLVKEYIELIEPEIRAGNTTSGIYYELERVWNIYYLTQIDNIADQLTDRKRNDPYLTPKDFNEVSRYLPSAIKDIKIVAIHSNSDDKLEYNDNNGNKYIAIGGNALSRGFTLEGLSINYFIRGTSNADTLMQMGRWFGYRPGYLDSCKLFTSREAIRRFDEASLIIEDLENKLDEMILDGKSPREFTIWVRDNPDVINLTRPNLLRNLHGLVLDFNDKLQRSNKFLINREKIETYYANFKSYIQSISNNWEERRSFVLARNITSQKITEALNIPGLKNVLTDLNIAGLDNFIKKANEQNLLNNWTIAISLTRGGNNQQIDLRNEFGINLMPEARLIKRSRGTDSNSIASLLNENIFKIRNSQIISPPDLGISFSQEKITEIETKYYRENLDKDSVDEKTYRRALSENEGLFIFYLIDPKYILDRDGLPVKYNNAYDDFINRNNLNDFNTPLVGCAVALPYIKNIDTSNYVTRRLIQLPVELKYEELVINAGLVGIEIDQANSKEEVLAIKNRLNIDFEYSDETSLTELKRSLLIAYLEKQNGND
jgi:hypothetical protein